MNPQFDPSPKLKEQLKDYLDFETALLTADIEYEQTTDDNGHCLCRKCLIDGKLSTRRYELLKRTIRELVCDDEVVLKKVMDIVTEAIDY